MIIEHEEKSQRSATFLFDFENGSSQLIIIIIGGILALVIVVGCCMLLWRYCCKKSNSSDFYREQFYAILCDINTPGQRMEMRSRRALPSIPHDTRNQTINKFNYSHKQHVNNNRNQYPVIEKKEEKNEDNGTEEQNGNKMQEIAELPNVAETLYPFIGKGHQNKKEQKNEDNGTEEQNNKKIEEKLYSETLYPFIGRGRQNKKEHKNYCIL